VTWATRLFSSFVSHARWSCFFVSRLFAHNTTSCLHKDVILPTADQTEHDQSFNILSKEKYNTRTLPDASLSARQGILRIQWRIRTLFMIAWGLFVCHIVIIAVVICGHVQVEAGAGLQHREPPRSVIGKAHIEGSRSGDLHCLSVLKSESCIETFNRIIQEMLKYVIVFCWVMHGIQESGGGSCGERGVRDPSWKTTGFCMRRRFRYVDLWSSWFLLSTNDKDVGTTEWIRLSLASEKYAVSQYKSDQIKWGILLNETGDEAELNWGSFFSR